MSDEVPLEVREAWNKFDRQLFAVANGISGTSIGEAIQACKDFAVANASRNKFDEIYYVYYVDPEKWEKELNHEVRNGQHCFAFNRCSPIDYLANTKAAELGIDANKLAWFPPLRRQLDLLDNVISRIPPFAFLLHRESERDDLIFAIRLYFSSRQTSVAGEAIKVLTTLKGSSPSNDRSVATQPCNESAVPNAARGFLGGVALADALGIVPERRVAFAKKLQRERPSFGNDCIEANDPQPNSPRFHYNADSQRLRDLASEYKRHKSV